MHIQQHSFSLFISVNWHHVAQPNCKMINGNRAQVFFELPHVPSSTTNHNYNYIKPGNMKLIKEFHTDPVPGIKNFPPEIYNGMITQALEQNHRLPFYIQNQACPSLDQQ